MNMKKIKKFFTFVRRKDGFTLVELIVVIAILAILGGVAVPAYSGYVKKANMQADISLASEVADALTLYYYSHPGTAGGLVVLTPEGADCQSDNDADDEASIGNAAMVAVFGEGWKESLNLKYGEWDSDMAGVLGAYTPEQLKKINESSYLATNNTKGLMNAVNQVTNLASKKIGDKNYTPDQIENNLKRVLGDTQETQDLIKTLKDNDLLTNETAISNMLVGAMADSMGDNPALTLIANDYAAAYAYGENTGDWYAYEQMTKNLENVSMAILTAEDEDDAITMLYAGFDDTKAAGYDAYIDEAAVSGKLQDDQDALIAMLSGVKEISGNFQDKDSLTNTQLFLEDDVLSQVDSYVNSVKALAGMDQATLTLLQNLPEGAVAILIAADGTVAVTPSAAFPA